MQVIQDLLPINFQSGRKGPYPPDCICIHVTEGNAESVRAWFKDPASSVSSHYLTTKKGAVYQFVRESDTAWANGRVDHPTSQLVQARAGVNPNWWTISIENEGSGHEELTTPQRKVLYELIQDIQSRNHRITTDRVHILGHREIYSLKTCPGAIDVDRIVADLGGVPGFSDVTGGSSSTAKPLLHRGMSGSDVAELQRLLGMQVGNGMGQFGPLTEAAVRSFQRRNRLPVDGIVGPDTWEALR